MRRQLSLELLRMSEQPLLALLLGAVLGTALLAVVYALEVKATTDNVVTHTWKVLNASTAHQHNSVLLQVVAFATDVSPDFVAAAQAHAGNLTQSRVWLLRGFGSYLYT